MNIPVRFLVPEFTLFVKSRHSEPARNALHVKVTNRILKDIESRKFPLGAKLPSQAELVAKYNVSVNTIRQSLQTLERRGIIRKEHGRGSFVSLQAGRSETNRTLRHVGLMFERGGKPEDRPVESEAILAFVDACRNDVLQFTIVESDIDAHLGGREMLKTFDGISLDGVCFCLKTGYDADERLRPLAREFPAPVALFPTFVDQSISIDTVDIENRTGLRQMMQYLLSLGHRRIGLVVSHMQACLNDDREQLTSRRWEVYSQALRQAGIPVDHSILVEIPYGQEPTPEIAKQIVKLVRRENPVTAIFAFNDWMARFAMESLWTASVKIPEEVSLVGLDDISFGRQMVPSLTTVALPYDKAAQVVIQLMRQRLADPNRPIQKITIPSELIVRQSVGPVSPGHTYSGENCTI